MDFYSTVFILVHPNGYVEDTVDGATFQSSEPLFMSIHRQKSLLELKNLILRNMGELERKQISRMAYRLHVKIGPQACDYQVFWLKSDQDIQLMFGYHDSNSELRCIELYVKVEDMISSASSKANPQVVQSENNVGRGAKRVQSPVTSPSFAFPILFKNSEAVDGKRSNICASPANMASRGVAVDKLLPPKTGNIGGACSAFPPPTSKKPSFVGTGGDLGLPPPPKMQKMVDGKGKPVENGVLLPDTEESNVYSKHFQAQGVCCNLEPPITSNSQMVLEGQVKELEIRLESKENERAALEELKVTLTAKISNLEKKLKEADKEKSQLREKKTASKGRIEQLEAEVKNLRCCVPEAKERAHRSIMEQVRHLAPGIDFSRVRPDYRVVNGEIVNPNKKDSVNNPPLPQDFASHNVNNPPLPHHVASQNVNNPPLSQKQSQDEGHLPHPVQASLQNSQTIGIQNLGKDPIPNNEVAKTLNSSSKSQYAKLQQMSKQQATVNEQPGGQINCQKRARFDMLLPILIPQLPKDRAMQLQTLFSKLKKDEIPQVSFVQLMRGIVGDHMLRLALSKVQAQLQAQVLQMRPNQGPVGQQRPVRTPTVGLGARQLNDPHVLAQLHQRSMNAAADQSRMTYSAVQTMENNARKSQELDVRMETRGLQPSQLAYSNSNTVNQEAER